MEPTQTDTRAVGAHLRRFVPPAILVIFGLGLLALIAEIVLVLSDSSPGNAEVRNGLAVVASFAAAAATLLTGISRPRGAGAPWLVLGLGIFSYSLGSFLLFFVIKALTVFPSSADFSWLAFYPFAIAAILLLVRQQRRSERLGIALDAAIVGTAVA